MHAIVVATLRKNEPFLLMAWGSSQISLANSDATWYLLLVHHHNQVLQTGPWLFSLQCTKSDTNKHTIDATRAKQNRLGLPENYGLASLACWPTPLSLFTQWSMCGSYKGWLWEETPTVQNMECGRCVGWVHSSLFDGSSFVCLGSYVVIIRNSSIPTVR